MKPNTEQSNYPHGTRLEALVVHNDHILVIKRFHKGNTYFVLPGGGWEPPETFEEGVSREVMEETSIQVNVSRLLFELNVTNDSRKVVYLCNYIGGNPILGDFNEKESMKNNPEDIYEPLWLPIGQVKKSRLYTLEFRDWFIENYQNGELPVKPVSLTITLDEFRKE